MDIRIFLELAISFVEVLPSIIQLAEQHRYMSARRILRKRRRDGLVAPKYLILDKISERLAFIERITQGNNRDCFKNLRMSNDAFKALCTVLKEECGLLDDHYVSVVEKVSIFLRILAHHQKNRVLQTDFQRSGQIISKVFNEVLRAVIKLRRRVIAQPVPVDETTTDRRFKWFKGCLGALDGTYVPVHVRTQDQPRYRTRKGHLATNVLGVCDINGRFAYMLAGWEGSAADSRVLRDAITRPNGLKIPTGTALMDDAGQEVMSKRVDDEAGPTRKRMKMFRPTKVYFTVDEEKALVACLQELGLEGWKTLQGWKKSVYGKAANKVNAQLNSRDILDATGKESYVQSFLAGELD